MKGMIIGVVGVGGVGMAAMAGGGGGPDDFVRHVNKSPQAVYAAFSGLGREGEVSLPSGGKGGWGARIKQRVVKVPNEQVKLELLVDDEALLTAEIQVSPEEGGTRLAAELDFNEQMLNRIVREQGGPPIPTFAMQDWLIDQVFAQAMDEMADRIEEGRPLLSLSDTHARWGRENGRPSRSGPSSGSSWEQDAATRPQLDARPALNPNAAARRHSGTN